ncbi:MAG: tetraacyldisaccharide 4'-kinase, partial [Thermoanaerobaculia bacterium]|nr:tetraacyldisaccharide 4'-kinase [Thermoanaerobaculia bacterium]
GRGIRPSVLTRGYGRATRGAVVVSDGAGAVASVNDSGDEAAVLARALPRVPIVADADRLAAARRVEELVPDVRVHLLDDGFSHVALARDLDIVLLDATAPDAGGALLPEGRLREPLSSLARADLVVVTKCEQADPAAARALANRWAPGAPVYHALTRVLGIRDDSGEEVRAEDLPGQTLVAVAALARPEAFFATLADLGIAPARVVTFRDHDPYGQFAMGRIEKAAEESGATAVVTTEKDAVKLEGRLRLPLFRVAVEMAVTENGFVEDALRCLARPPS